MLLRSLVSYVLLVVMSLLVIDMVCVLFLGGLRIQLGDVVVTSTSIEFPVLALVAATYLLLLSWGKWRECLLSLVAIVVAGVMGEVALRALDHPWSKPYVDYEAWYRPSNVFGHELVPGFEGIGPLGILVKVNSNGFRDDEPGSGKPDGTIRVLGVGDSFTFGWGVSGEETFLKQLEVRALEAGGPVIETVNAGVPGWGLSQYQIFIENVGGSLRPDVVVLAYFLDDLSDGMRDHIPANPAHEGGLRFKGGMLHQSRLYNFSKSLADSIRHKNRVRRTPHLHDLSVRRAEWAGRTQHLVKLDSSPKTRKQEELLEAFLERIQRVVSRMNSRLVVMYIPDVSQLHHPELQHVNRVLEGLSRQREISFLDMTPLFERERDPQAFYLWPRDAHTNARGHRLMAEELYDTLCRLGVLEGPGLRRPQAHCGREKSLR